MSFRRKRERERDGENEKNNFLNVSLARRKQFRC
jgi:hypothetical protein